MRSVFGRFSILNFPFIKIRSLNRISFDFYPDSLTFAHSKNAWRPQLESHAKKK